MAVDHRQSTLSRDPNNHDNAVLLGYDLAQLASVLAGGDFPGLEKPEAVSILQQSITVSQQAVERDHENQMPRSALVIALLRLAQSKQAERPEEAIAIYHRALAAAQDLAPEYAAHPEIGVSFLYTIIAPLARRGRYAEAREYFVRSRAFLESRLTKDPSDLYASYHLSGAWMYWADAQSDRAEALTASQAAERVIESGIRTAPDDFLMAWRLAQILDRRCAWLEAGECQETTARLAALWKRWADRYPDSAFHRRQLRRVRPEPKWKRPVP
jgi:tetratricopeptide (TPR) repeat protein